MGTFSYFLGEIDIPEEDRAEYGRQALTMLRAGGMMSLDWVHLHGKKFCLLFPPELNDKGEASFHYNYLDNESGETWGLSAAAGGFGGGKIGGSCFYDTVLAVEVLTCLFSKTYSAVTVDGRLIREEPYIRWLNGVLGTSYTNWRATQVWTLEKLLHEEERDNRYNRNLFALGGHVPAECVDIEQAETYLSACHLDEFMQNLMAVRGEDGQQTGEEAPEALFFQLLQENLKEYHRRGGDLEEAKKCLVMTAEERGAAAKEQDRIRLLFLARFVPPTAAVTMTAREFGVDFWSIWDEIGENIPDERGTQPRPAKPCPPVTPMADTRRMLELDGDDMAYYWTPDALFRFSEKMTAWMKGLRAELDGVGETIPAGAFLSTLAAGIAGGDGTFFRDAFYEFIHRQDEEAVQKAVLLLGRMGQRKDEHIRTYIAILGNPILRERVLGF